SRRLSRISGSSASSTRASTEARVSASAKRSTSTPPCGAMASFEKSYVISSLSLDPDLPAARSGWCDGQDLLPPFLRALRDVARGRLVIDEDAQARAGLHVFQPELRANEGIRTDFSCQIQYFGHSGPHADRARDEQVDERFGRRVVDDHGALGAR